MSFAVISAVSNLTLGLGKLILQQHQLLSEISQLLFLKFQINFLCQNLFDLFDVCITAFFQAVGQFILNYQIGFLFLKKFFPVGFQTAADGVFRFPEIGKFSSQFTELFFQCSMLLQKRQTFCFDFCRSFCMVIGSIC